MKLKSISISGFKTFADKVFIQFHDGITGIIGPNGTGKSNVVAAVRWALGELTAKNLRDPAEVIFIGSQNRKPLNMAEVILSFTNDGKGCPPEYLHLPEISLGRRVFRDGEREYFINKEPCRLRDIVDFLLSIGIAARGYSIIEQEKRDRIIQASPEGMREILEESAGITIFKQHRADAEKRLASTADKMGSLAEVENELKKQAEHLKEQSEKVEQKKKLVSRLKDREIAILCYRVADYRGKSKKLKIDIEEKQKEIQSSVIESTEWESLANEYKAEQIELQCQLKEIENDLEEKKIALTKYTERAQFEKKNISDRNKRKQLLQQTLEDERKNLEREEARISSCLTDLQKHEHSVKEVDSLIISLTEQLDEAEEALREDRSRGEEIKSEIRAIQELMSTLRGKSEAILERISRANSSMQKNLEQSNELEMQKRQFVADKESMQKQLSTISNVVDESTKQKISIEGEIAIINSELDKIRETRDAAKHELMLFSSTLASLQKLQTSNEGLSDGTKVLRTKLASFIKGFVFEAIQVNLKDEEILEKAIPELLETAIVDNTDEFIELLDKVEEIDLSRVGFLISSLYSPLSPLEESLKSKLLSMSGIRSVGDNVASYSNLAVKPIMDRIFIVRDEWILFKAQREVSASGIFGFIFISERGTVFSGNREIYFGKNSNSASGNILQRKREIAELEMKKAAAQQTLATFEGQVFELSEKKKKYDNEIYTIESYLSKEKVEVVKMTSSIEIASHRIRNHEDTLSKAIKEIEQFRKEISSSQELYASQLQQIDDYEKELKEYESELYDFEYEQRNRKERKDVLVSKLNEKNSLRALCAERAENARRAYEETSYHLKRMQAGVDKNIAELTELNAAADYSQDNIASIEREITRLKVEVNDASLSLDQALNREAKVSEELRVLENKLKSQKTYGESRQKFISDRQMEYARIEAILDTALKDAFEKFMLSPKDLPEAIPEENKEKEENIEKEINDLKKQLEEFGLVNERAYEEYNEVSERLQFLENQKGDITRSVEELQKAIAEIEETTKTRFKEIYEAVNSEFRILFPTLFPGGEANLNLTNPADLLTTGVEILVRLPGKKLQRMHLFSGGEKALTAISLIFALLKTNPTPFCFLDEVDAPLDEANVGRFNEVISMLSSQFQFIVITHNRRTMEVLDRIYGISMQDPGVSKLVAVDLTEVPEHLQKKKVQPLAVSRSGAEAQDRT